MYFSVCGQNPPRSKASKVRSPAIGSLGQKPAIISYIHMTASKVLRDGWMGKGRVALFPSLNLIIQF